MSNYQCNKNNFHFNLENSSGDQFSVLKVQSNFYGISLPYWFDIYLLSHKEIQWSNCQCMCGKLFWSNQNNWVFFNGFIAEIKNLGIHEDKHTYRIRLASPLLLLKYSQHNRVFVEKTPQEIIVQILEPYKKQLEFCFDLKKHQQKINFFMQYNETDHDCLKKILAQSGILFYSDQKHKNSVVKFFDDLGLLETSQINVAYREHTGMCVDDGSVFAIEVDCSVITEQVIAYGNRVDDPAVSLCDVGHNQAHISGEGKAELYIDHVGSIEELQKNTQCSQNKFDQCRLHISLRSTFLNLIPGQIIYLKGHAIPSFNQSYRIISIVHHIDLTSRSMRYHNCLKVIPIAQKFESTYSVKPKSILVRAKLDANQEDYPLINEVGNYYLKCFFDDCKNTVKNVRRIQPYGGKTNQQQYGIHYAWRAETEVVVGFEDYHLSRPIILGSVSNVLSLNPVTNYNCTYYRLRSWAGNELLMNDDQQHYKINLHTRYENQLLHLVANKNSPHIQFACQNGEIRVVSNQNVQLFNGQNFSGYAGKDFYERAGLIYQAISKGGKINIISKKNIDLFSQGDVHAKSLKNDVLIDSKRDLKVHTRNKLTFGSNDYSFNVSALSGVIRACGQKMQLISRGKVSIGKAVDISQGEICFSNADFNAPIINIYPPMSAGANNVPHEKEHKIPAINDKKQIAGLKLFPLIAVNLRSDIENIYFKSESMVHDEYRKSQLSPVELAYFANHGNNATIFIHGYSIPYGVFGGLIKTHYQEILKHTIFNYKNIYRDMSFLEKEFPDASIHDIPINAAASLVMNEQNDYLRVLENSVRYPLSSSESLLNGTGAHNWWLRMEWNLNYATGQFDGFDYSKYTRILNLAWQGDPRTSLDYIACIESAANAGERLVPIIQQLYRAGIEVNIIAHSLGNHVLLKAMDIIGKSQQNCLNHVFMWDAAVPNNALFANRGNRTDDIYYFPFASRAAKTITTLYSHHDTILGPWDDDDECFWGKMHESGFEMVLLMKGLQLIDQHNQQRKLKSIYNIANTIGVPLSHFFQSRQYRYQYYYRWISHHKTCDGQAFEMDLEAQLKWIRKKYPQAFNLISIAVAAAKYGVEMAMYKWKKFLLNNFVDDRVEDLISNEIATIVITVFISDGEEPRLAMGYSGPDQDTMDQLGEKLIAIDQTSWLYSHSGMRIPNDDVMKNVYQKIIWKGNPDYHFGKYKK